MEKENKVNFSRGKFAVSSFENMLSFLRVEITRDSRLFQLLPFSRVNNLGLMFSKFFRGPRRNDDLWHPQFKIKLFLPS